MPVQAEDALEVQAARQMFALLDEFFNECRHAKTIASVAIAAGIAHQELVELARQILDSAS